MKLLDVAIVVMLFSAVVFSINTQISPQPATGTFLSLFNLNLRDSPAGKSIGLVRKGTVVNALGNAELASLGNTEYVWQEVSDKDGNTGWVAFGTTRNPSYFVEPTNNQPGSFVLYGCNSIPVGSFVKIRTGERLTIRDSPCGTPLVYNMPANGNRADYIALPGETFKVDDIAEKQCKSYDYCWAKIDGKKSGWIAVGTPMNPFLYAKKSDKEPEQPENAEPSVARCSDIPVDKGDSIKSLLDGGFIVGMEDLGDQIADVHKLPSSCSVMATGKPFLAFMRIRNKIPDSMMCWIPVSYDCGTYSADAFVVAGTKDNPAVAVKILPQSPPQNEQSDEYILDAVPFVVKMDCRRTSHGFAEPRNYAMKLLKTTLDENGKTFDALEISDNPSGSYHTGVDYACSSKTPVYLKLSKGAEVFHVGPLYSLDPSKGFGPEGLSIKIGDVQINGENYIMLLNLGHGTTSLKPRQELSPGSYVEIYRTGNLGNSFGPHLHLEVALIKCDNPIIGRYGYQCHELKRGVPLHMVPVFADKIIYIDPEQLVPDRNLIAGKTGGVVELS